MQNYFEILKKVPIFQGADDTALGEMLSCWGGKTKKYNKNEAIIEADEPVKAIGIVLEGAVQINKEDALGQRVIVTEFSPGELFGESLAAAGVPRSPINAIASTDSIILLIEYDRLITTCSTSCPHHRNVIFNMMRIMAQKNLLLNQKMEILSGKTIRDRLMTYFAQQMRRNKAAQFTIPFSREELADFICINRSAMSRELKNMQDEGIIDYDKNTFQILTR